MINLNLSIGGITITPLFWALAVAFVLSSYSIWKRLKEDYAEEIIFSLTLMNGFFALVFSRLFFVLINFSQFSFSVVSWLTKDVAENFSLSGAFFGFFLATKWKLNSKRNLWEVLDSLSLPIMYFFLLGGLGFFLSSWSFLSLSFCFVAILGLSLYPFLRKNYRSFAWYKSGKTGFLFCVYSLYSFIFLLVLAFFKTDILYLNRLILFFLILFSLSALYIRSERDLRDDIRALIKRRKI